MDRRRTGYAVSVLMREPALSGPVGKALWFVESHFAEEISLDDVAAAAGVSRYHMSRAFSVATGQSVMRYVRARRLTESAKALANGAPDILAVAIDTGYGSHEAFTRAFREQFGITPEMFRARAATEHPLLLEPIKMDETLLTQLDPPRYEDGKTLLIGGIGERYNAETSARIPAQWQRFVPHLGHISGQAGSKTYGVLCNGDDSGNIDYISGVEVTDFSRLPDGWAHIRIPEQHYAVFTHRGHVSGIRRTWHTIYNKWLPESGRQVTGGPEFELYDERFNGMTGDGEFEIWIPLKA